jgi:hypothetical protein
MFAQYTFTITLKTRSLTNDVLKRQKKKNVAYNIIIYYIGEDNKKVRGNKLQTLCALVFIINSDY